MNLVAIPPLVVHRFWTELVPGLRKLLDKGTVPYETEEIKAGIENGTWILFIAMDDQTPLAYFICRIKSAVFEVGLCWGGRMAEWGDSVIESFELVARESGCTKLTIGGRPGWVKLGKQYGFKPKSITIVKEL